MRRPNAPLPQNWRQVVVGRKGNAIDAAAAAFYMTAVTEPNEAGLGGDGRRRS